MDRLVWLSTSSMLPWRKPIIKTQWTDSSEIYQKWYSAVNEKAMASPLPIHHQWCIADKQLGSNKLLLRGWPRWWKWKLPHGHPCVHSPLFSIQQSALVSVQENSYQHYYFLGVVCVHWQKRTNTQFVSRHEMESSPTGHQCLEVEFKGHSWAARQMCFFADLSITCLNSMLFYYTPGVS